MHKTLHRVSSVIKTAHVFPPSVQRLFICLTKLPDSARAVLNSYLLRAITKHTHSI